MTIAIGYLGPRVPNRQQSQQRKRKPPPTALEAQALGLGAPAPAWGQDAVSPLRNEQQRAEIAALDQAVQAAETAMALTDRALQGLVAADQCLARLYLSVTRAVEDPAGGALRQRVSEIETLLAHLDAIGTGTRFGDRSLLDGSLGARGDANGEGLQFVSASPSTRSSPADGYAVVVSAPPLRARLSGERPLTPELLKMPLRLRVQEGERYAELRTRGGESYEQLCDTLLRTLRGNGMDLHLVPSAERRLVIEHDRFGPGHSFWAESHPPGVLSRRDGKPGVARDGRHIAGTLHGEPAQGRGELLIGKQGNPHTEGLCVAFSGPLPDWFVQLAARGQGDRPFLVSEGIAVGRVSLVQRGLTFRFDPADMEGVRLQLPMMRAASLATRVVNRSGFASLAAIRVESVRQARDAVRLVEDAIRELHEARARTEEVLRRQLMPHLNGLRVRIENLNAGASTIGDPALAGRVAQYVSARLEDDRSLARVAQVNPQPGAVMKLIN